MKITDVKPLFVNTFLYVRVYTDEGLVGLGESGAWGYQNAAAEVVNTFKEYLIGKDPLRIEHHWQYMYRAFHFRGAAIMGAISAIDIALWDIAGKFYDVPVYRLLGGGCRDKARTYMQVSGATTEELVENCIQAKKVGYTAVGHLNPFLDTPRKEPFFSTYANMLDEAAERVAIIRDAVGNDVDLCLELHRRLKPAEAIAFAHKVERFTPMFLEDPIPPDNFDEMANVAAGVHVPIATGERIHTIQEYNMLFSRNAMAYARTCVCLCGGLSGAKKIAAMAEAKGVQIVPHNPLSPVSSAVCLQLAAAVENFAIMELPDHSMAATTERYSSSPSTPEEVKAFHTRDIATWSPQVTNGFASLPEAPGIGVDLVEDAEKRFPYKRKALLTRLHVDGSVVDQ